MSRCVRRRCAAAACVVAAVIILGSCSLGFLGDSFTLEGQIYSVDRSGSPVATTYNGTVGFLMEGKLDDLAIGTVKNGAFDSVEIPVPTDTLKWSDMLPPATPPLTISDGTVHGYIINKIIVNDKDAGLMTINRMNPDLTAMVWYAYTAADVQISANSSYSSPLGGTATMVGDLTFKAGWNRMVLVRSGSTGAYTDTWTVGNEPDGLYWLVPPG